MSCLKLGIDRIKKSLTDLREWVKEPSQELIEARRIAITTHHLVMETVQRMDHSLVTVAQCLEALSQDNRDQTDRLTQCIEAMAGAQAKQAEAFQTQVQSILELWKQPIVDPDRVLRSPREQELLRDLNMEAKNGNSLAEEYLKPENAAQLEEYLRLFNES
jgi:hypothetical protein